MFQARDAIAGDALEIGLVNVIVELLERVLLRQLDEEMRGRGDRSDRARTDIAIEV